MKGKTYREVRELYRENPNLHVTEIMERLNIDRDTAVTHLLWAIEEEGKETAPTSELEKATERMARAFDKLDSTITEINGNLRKGKAALETELTAQERIATLDAKDGVNTAHLAFHANAVLETLGMETEVVAFWENILHNTAEGTREMLTAEFGNIFSLREFPSSSYDAWKLDSPPEFDTQTPCEVCSVLTDNGSLCKDCQTEIEEATAEIEEMSEAYTEAENAISRIVSDLACLYYHKDKDVQRLKNAVREINNQLPALLQKLENL